jgi:glycerol-3-phosphate dehydrogenase
MQLSGLDRNKIFSSAKQTELFTLKDRYNVIVIGGGIQGASISWEAASRGISVLLLEQNDFGSGVSANSLKIIHGCIRYLQKLDLTRMRQSIRERRTLLRIAPHLVRPMRCIIPAFRGFGKGKFVLLAGTRIYDWIAADRNRGLDPAQRIEKSRILPYKEFKRLYPVHDQKDIVGGASWWDAQVHNSERLVLAFVMSAKSMGADVCNYVQVGEIIQERGRARGVVAEDLPSGEKREIKADVIMDCTGPGLGDDLSTGIRPYARAMNLIVRRRLADFAFGIRSQGNVKRLLFFVPWQDGGMIGTWYHHARTDDGSDALTVSQHDIEMALSEVNRVLPEPVLRFEEVTAVHLGLLPAFKGTNDFGEPRLKDRFMIADSADKGAAGLFRVQGVKYTTARDVATKAIRAASHYLPVKPKSSKTHFLPLYGGDIGEIKKFQNHCFQRYTPDFSQSIVTRLMDNYGSHIHHILAYANSSAKLGHPVPGAKNVLQAELVFVLDNEMVRTLSDLIFRRTDLGTFAMPAEKTIEFCADFMADHLGWDIQTRCRNIKTLYSRFPRWIQGVKARQW